MGCRCLRILHCVLGCALCCAPNSADMGATARLGEIQPSLIPPLRHPLQLNDWFLGSRDPETGEYADLPAADKGGSRAIIHPAPPQPSAEEAAAAAANASKAGAAASKGSGAGKPGGGKGKAAAGEEEPRCSQAFLEGLRMAVQQYMDVWQEYEPSNPSAALRELALPCRGRKQV